jgi:hypothetical protein
MRPDLNGKWIVKLIYGASFGHLEHEALLFTIDVVQQEDEFTGTCRDVDGIGLSPYESQVNGFMDAERINFVKEYKVPVLFHNEQKASLPQEPAGREASFYGTYNSATGGYEGEWLIVSDFTVMGNVFFEGENGGTWSMTREER